MKKCWGILVLVALTLAFSPSAFADPVNLYLDTGPNDSTFTAFKNTAYANIVGNTFVNQAHSFNPANQGTYKYEVEDYMVYSWGNGGKRLHAFYWIPNTTVAALTNRFQISIEYNYGGTLYNPFEEYNWGTWVTPTSWTNYQGGVIGTFGNALWGAADYNSPTPAALAALASDTQDARNYLGNTQFLARLDGVTYTLTAEHTPAVPLPGAVWLLGSGLAGLGLLRGRKWFNC